MKGSQRVQVRVFSSEDYLKREALSFEEKMKKKGEEYAKSHASPTTLDASAGQQKQSTTEPGN